MALSAQSRNALRSRLGAAYTEVVGLLDALSNQLNPESDPAIAGPPEPAVTGPETVVTVPPVVPPTDDQEPENLDHEPEPEAAPHAA